MAILLIPQIFLVKFAVRYLILVYSVTKINAHIVVLPWWFTKENVFPVALIIIIKTQKNARNVLPLAQHAHRSQLAFLVLIHISWMTVLASFNVLLMKLEWHIMEQFNAFLVFLLAFHAQVKPHLVHCVSMGII